jgi:parvulin-like peptidyl-prolyl isomerase
MRLIRPALLLVLVALVVAACGGSDGGSDGAATTVEKPEVPAGAVAVVGDETITQEQFDALYDTAVKQGEAGGQPVPEAGSEEETTLRQQVMQALVQNAVIRQEADERGIAVDQAKVDEDLKGFKDQCCGGKQEDYETYLKDNGLTEEGLRDQFALQQQAQALYEEVTKDVKVTDAQAQEQYDKDKEALYTTARSRKVAHILLDVKPKGESTQADCDRAEEVIAELDAGGDFAALAKKYSADPGSKDTGGEYTITDDDNWDADFRKGSFDLETGETSGPVKSQFGCHIIRALEDVVPPATQPFADVQQQIVDQLTQERKNEAATTWFEEAQASFEARTAFAKGYSLPPVPEAEPTDTTGTGAETAE